MTAAIPTAWMQRIEALENIVNQQQQKIEDLECEVAALKKAQHPKSNMNGTPTTSLSFDDIDKLSPAMRKVLEAREKRKKLEEEKLAFLLKMGNMNEVESSPIPVEIVVSKKVESSTLEKKPETSKIVEKKKPKEEDDSNSNKDVDIFSQPPAYAITPFSSDNTKTAKHNEDINGNKDVDIFSQPPAYAITPFQDGSKMFERLTISNTSTPALVTSPLVPTVPAEIISVPTPIPIPIPIPTQNDRAPAVLKAAAAALNLATLDEIQEIDLKCAVQCVALYENLLCCSAGRGLKIWKIVEERAVSEKATTSLKDAHEGDVNSIIMTRYDEDEEVTIISGGSEGIVKTWAFEDIALPQICSLRSMIGHTDAVLSVNHGAIDRTIVSSSQDSTICVWVDSASKPTMILQGHTAAVTCTVATVNFIISASEDKSIRLWSRKNGVSLCVVDNAHTDAIYTLSLYVALNDSNNISNKNNKKAAAEDIVLVSAGANSIVNTWKVDSNSMTLIKTFNGHDANVCCSCVCNSTDAFALFLTGSDDGVCMLWDYDNGYCAQCDDVSRGAVISMTYANQLVAAASDSGIIKLWRLN